MKVVIAYKWSRDEAGASVRKDGTVDWGNAKMAPGDDDHAALAAAQAIAADGGDLVGLTLGDGDASWALARGVEAAWSVTDAPYLLDNATIGAILAAAVRHLGGVDVVVIGDSDQNPGVAAALAGQLGWPALAGVTTAEVAGGRIKAVRRLGDVEQTISTAGPVVIAVAAMAAESKAPGMKEMLAARKRPVTAISLAELAVSPAEPVARLGTAPPDTPGAVLFAGEPDDAVRQLIGALQSEGVL